MEQLLYILPALACPVGMGLMMWFMMRGRSHSGAGTPEQAQELAQLRAQVQALSPAAVAPVPLDERHAAAAGEKSTPA